METPLRQERHSKRQNILFRPRVEAIFEKAAEFPLVTVTAGTGYGKSQAVTAYLERANTSYVWLQLTRLDNYTLRFWDSFTAAVQSNNPEFARFMANIGFPDTMEKLYRFLKELAKVVYTRGRWVLVLDDFHKIEDATLINFIESLSFAAIEQLTIILITRHPLQLDYTSLQNNNLLGTVNIADLRFTEEETRAYFAMLGMDFPEQVLQNILSSCEGWPLAIYLVGLHQSKSGQLFNDPVACTLPLLYGLIETEIYNEYSADIKRLFVKLSVMETIPLDMVRAISGNLYADMVAHLRENMFVHFNAQTEQYYFHRLLRLFLREKQVDFTGEEMGRLYQQIGDWYFDHRKYLEALSFYQKSGNNARMWQAIRCYGLDGYRNDYANMCLSCISDLTPEFAEANPLVRVMRGHLLMHINSLDRAHFCFLDIKEEYESLPLTPERKIVLGEAYIGLAFTYQIYREYVFADYFVKAYEYLPNGSELVHNSNSYLGNSSALNLYEYKKGAVQKTVDTVFRAMPKGSYAMNGLAYGLEYLVAAEASYYRGEMRGAEEYAHQAIYRAQQKKQHDLVCNAFSILGRICFSEGDYEGSIRYIRQIRQYCDSLEYSFRFGYGMDEIGESWFFIRIGHSEQTESWIVNHSLDNRFHSLLNIGREKVIQAHYLYCRGEYYELLALLDVVGEIYKQHNLTLLILQVYILKAMCHFRLGRQDKMLEQMRLAYEIAYPDGLIMSFVEFGKQAQDMLDELLGIEHGMDEAFLEELRGRCAHYARMQASIKKEYEHRHKGGKGAIQLFTDREKNVLTLLCDNYTREEIATHFDLSVNTVKTVLKDVFSKLGAINRTDAIRIARDKHIIE